MNEQSSVPIAPPALPKGGGAIQSIGNNLGTVGTRGTASFEIPLPVTPGRGFAPALTLRYSNAQGNGMFGLGWALSLGTIARRTRQGVPAYTDDDLFVGPDGEVWMPERDKTTGAFISKYALSSNGKTLEQYTVVRYSPRVEAAFDRIEHWFSATDQPGFWLIYRADGSQHLFGKTPAARRADSNAPSRVGEWLLEESMNAHGEHIVYEYTPDEVTARGPADNRAQRYLSRVCYGNFTADSQLYLCKVDGLKDKKWHFELCFDYGERSVRLEDTPGYKGTQPYAVRSDPFSDFAYGFELRTERLCQQVLMFHYFPNEPSMGDKPVLIRRLLLQYQTCALSYSCLSAALPQTFGETHTDRYQPPLEFGYSGFTLKPEARHYKPFEALARLNHQDQFQFVDLKGEGLPGILHRTDQSWRYSQPLRDDRGGDHIMYAAWSELPRIPLADRRKSPRQYFSDLNDDSRPDWIVAHPEFSGFFTLNSNDEWSNYTPLAAVPTEFFHPEGQLASLMGNGRNDLIMIGPRSVRLYANQKITGFAPATQVSRHADEDDLPQPGNSPSELVAFSDLLGSGQQHLIRVRHNEVKCWPNLGRGRFAKGRVIATLDFAYEQFDASRILMADLDGSGAADLIYLQPDCAKIFMNRGGNGLAPAVELPWPQGLRHDRFCKVSAVDLLGLGCSSLIFSVPGDATRHWRYDFVETKPYLLETSNNNMGAACSVSYRSSAQEWLDEKKQLLKNNKPAISHLPFPLFLVKQQSQHDEITGNRLTQKFKYRRGFYDSIEREFRGFGLLLQTDSPTHGKGAQTSPHSAPMLTKTWFHTGQAIDPLNRDYDRNDKDAIGLRATIQVWGEHWGPPAPTPEAVLANAHARQRELARALSGRTLRIEIFGLDKGTEKEKHPYSVQQHRYRVVERQGLGKYSPYSIMQPLVVESISYQYERISDDPRCTHTINLEWDAYGHLTHSLEISYARRKTPADAPPFMDTWLQKWWRDAHDEDQQYYYLSETKAQFIHISTAQALRLGLRYLQRTNALRLPKSPLAAGLSPQNIHYENLLERSTSKTWEDRRTLTGLSVQRYRKPDASGTFDDGQASVEGLIDHQETAEFNKLALSVYDEHKSEDTSFDVTKLLQDNGYRKMPIALPPDEDWDKNNPLWSVRRSFSTYYKLAGFYRAQTFRQSQQHGPTTITHDPYSCLIATVELPDQCTTRATKIGYRTLQPKQISDPNGNFQEAQYSELGQVHALTWYKNGVSENVGFKPMATYSRPTDDRPDTAIDDPGKALQNIASAFFYDSLSWMGRIPAVTGEELAWRKKAVDNNDLLPTGHIRASTRARLSSLSVKTPYEQTLQTRMDGVQREPVHCVTMQADRFCSDSEKQVRITIACWDGVGRQLQKKQRVAPGKALDINEDGTLKLENDTLQERDVSFRWRVSERVEYDNKGLVIRTYRPYFSTRHRYVNDESLRKSGLCDQQFHDPQGRLLRVVNANGDERRHTYHPWYSTIEDENDTQPDTTTQGGAQ